MKSILRTTVLFLGGAAMRSNDSAGRSDARGRPDQGSSRRAQRHGQSRSPGGKARWVARACCLILLVGLLPLLANARDLTPDVQDSLHSVHPRQRAHWLKERGIDYPGYTSPLLRDSLNMRCVGRWSYGPAYDITGRITEHDTILFLARGSGVSVLRFHGGAQPGVTLLSDINAVGLVHRVVVQDS